jgi:peptide/nickel transport system ATP-binding protein
MGLSIKGLTVSFLTKGHLVRAVDGVSLEIRNGSCLALVGESGSGKTTIGLACMGLLPSNAILDGTIELDGTPLDYSVQETARKIRWRHISMVFQSGAASLNPVKPVLDQVAEPMAVTLGSGWKEARKGAARAMELMGLGPDLHQRFPHELSGGQAQRILLAMATILDPPVMILDEPTANLDVVTKAFVGGLLGEAKKRGKALLLVGHDLDFIVRWADEVAVMYLGQTMECLPAGRLLTFPRHPYSWALVRSYPSMKCTRDLGGIRGDALQRVTHQHGRKDPSAYSHAHDQAHGVAGGTSHAPEEGCLFWPRCTQALGACREGSVELTVQGDFGVRCLRGGVVDLLRLKGVSKRYGETQALHPTDLEIRAGEVLCLVGETGSGKTTLAMIAAGVLRPDSGARLLDEQDMDEILKQDRTALARQVGIVYQDPASSVSHRFTVEEIVAEPMKIHRAFSKEGIRERVEDLLRKVHLPWDKRFMALYPHELSQGTIQRVCLARALALRPKLLVADEPTSSLDPSAQAKVMRLLMELQIEEGLTLLFVTHDIGLARKIGDRLAVMLAGRIVELGPAATLLALPLHPYTQMLIRRAEGDVNEGPLGQGSASPQACAFAPRCRWADERCRSESPPNLHLEDQERTVRCFRFTEEGRETRSWQDPPGVSDESRGES